MTSRPTRIAQTTVEAKKAYKKNGPRLSDNELRRLQRGVELDERAARVRRQDEQRRAAKRKREDKERKEREARKQLGVGLATQMIGYSHTQAKLKTGMEAFLGLKKRKTGEDARQADVSKKLDAIAEVVDKATPKKDGKDPWDDEVEEDFGLEGLPDLEAGGEDSLMDDDLDDDTLLEATDLFMSDALGGPLYRPTIRPSSPCPAPACVPEKPAIRTEDMAFLRLHGPINKALSQILDALPEPLIELLSVDCSTNQPTWVPPLSLLYKLNPVGLPPHRLHIKVGCVVSLLRDLNTNSSQLSKSNHLRILRAENERLECLVLDGQLEGTKTILTRVPFHAKYKNEDQYPFKRLQFPIRVSTNFTPPKPHRDTSQTTFKVPSIPGRPHQPPPTFKKPAIPKAAAGNANPVFKMPGLPASKSIKAPVQKTTAPVVSITLDGWEDFLDSGTQIARELSSDGPPAPEKQTSSSLFSPDDVGFTVEDLEELALSQFAQPNSTSISRPATSSHASIAGPDNLSGRSAGAKGEPVLRSRPAVQRFTIRHNTPSKTVPYANNVKSHQLAMPAISRPAIPKPENPATPTPVQSIEPGLSEHPEHVHSRPFQSFVQKPTLQPRRQMPPPKVIPPVKSVGSVGDFDLVLSTQEFNSFYEDDFS